MAKQSFTPRSTAISNATYDDETQELDLTFTGGETFTFEGVPPEVWVEFQAAPSPGSYYHAKIKGAY